jgi:Ni,Fe-hydrogenase maturation factor
VLLIVDAVDFGAIWQIRVVTPDEIHGFTFSTHALALHLSIDLIRRERKLEVYDRIQAARTKLGDCLTRHAGVQWIQLDTFTKLFRPGQ